MTSLDVSALQRAFLYHVLRARLTADWSFCNPAGYHLWQGIGRSDHGKPIAFELPPQGTYSQAQELLRRQRAKYPLLRFATAWELVSYACTQWLGQSQVLALESVLQSPTTQALRVPRLDPGRKLVSAGREASYPNGVSVLCTICQ